jgi:hypothetical protein
MFWTVLVLLVILWVLGIASQSQDFTADVSAPLDWTRECSSPQASYKLERNGKTRRIGSVGTIRMLR